MTAQTTSWRPKNGSYRTTVSLLPADVSIDPGRLAYPVEPHELKLRDLAHLSLAQLAEPGQRLPPYGARRSTLVTRCSNLIRVSQLWARYSVICRRAVMVSRSRYSSSGFGQALSLTITTSVIGSTKRYCPCMPRPVNA